MSIQVVSAARSLPGASQASSAPTDVADSTGFAGLLAVQLREPSVSEPLPLPSDIQISGEDAQLLLDSKDMGDKKDEHADDATIEPNLVAQLLPWLPQQTPVAANTPVETPKLVSDPGLAQITDKTALPAEDLASQEAPLDLDRQSQHQQRLLAANDSAKDARAANTPVELAATNGKERESFAARFADKDPETSASNTLTAMAATTAAQSPKQAAAAPAQITTPLHDNRWATDFSQKVVWIARADQQSAQINIHPPQLGPIQITINIEGDKASAAFASAHAEVRQAIETAMPRLREMMSEAGINLGQTNVGSQFSPQNQGQENRQKPSESPRFAVDNAILSSQPGSAGGTTISVSQGRGLVDLFA